MVIAAVGQKGMCEELERYDLMDSDRVRADFSSMRTSDPKVFAAGDGAFGGSTIVMAMHHGQRAAYYVKSYLDDIHEPLPYRTPFRTRRVPVAQDLLWETMPQCARRRVVTDVMLRQGQLIIQCGTEKTSFRWLEQILLTNLSIKPCCSAD